MLNTLKNSVLLKVIGLVFLTLLLCWPLEEIQSLIRERGHSQQEAATELARTYTGQQTVVGPLVVVPYVERWMEVQRNADGKVIGEEARSKTRNRVLFPERLKIDGELVPETRYRGIFSIPFYKLDAMVAGTFAPFDSSALVHSENASTLTPGAPFVAFNVSDLRGLDGSPTLVMNGAPLRFERSGGRVDDVSALAGGLVAPLSGEALAAWNAGRPMPFDMKLALVGQQTLSIVPLADETEAHLHSSWAAPSFGGQFLAAERTVSEAGFDARWRVSALVSSAREQLVTGGEVARDGEAAPAAAAAAAATVYVSDVASQRASARRVRRDLGSLQTFDVTLAQPLNVYSMATRAAKYGALFIGLVLMAAFMAEVFKRLRLHPVQYGLVGLSIALFFLLLLALSEKLAFWVAYASAAGASVLLLTLYFGAVLGGWRRGAGFGAYVALLYAALYGLLASESNALLLGALLTFGMLALLMLATRKVDWYALSVGRAKDPAPKTPVSPPADGAMA